jgi:hypothetical protein
VGRLSGSGSHGVSLVHYALVLIRKIHTNQARCPQPDWVGVVGQTPPPGVLANHAQERYIRLDPCICKYEVRVRYVLGVVWYAYATYS